MPTPPIADHTYPELARNLCCAFIAHQLGVSMATAEKSHMPAEVGEFWHEMAEYLAPRAVEAIFRRGPDSQEFQ